MGDQWNVNGGSTGCQRNLMESQWEVGSMVGQWWVNGGSMVGQWWVNGGQWMRGQLGSQSGSMVINGRPMGVNGQSTGCKWSVWDVNGESMRDQWVVTGVSMVGQWWVNEGSMGGQLGVYGVSMGGQ